jgi:hypothetical protein
MNDMMKILLEAAEEQIRFEESLKFKNHERDNIANDKRKVDAFPTNIGEFEFDNDFYDI